MEFLTKDPNYIGSLIDLFTLGSSIICKQFFAFVTFIVKLEVANKFCNMQFKFF